MENIQDNVKLADGKITKVAEIGAGVIKCISVDDKIIQIKITDVLFVPALDENLLSVKKLVSKGLNVVFSNESCKIKNREKTIAEGTIIEGLYKLK